MINTFSFGSFQIYQNKRAQQPTGLYFIRTIVSRTIRMAAKMFLSNELGIMNIIKVLHNLPQKIVYFVTLCLVTPCMNEFPIF